MIMAVSKRKSKQPSDTKKDKELRKLLKSIVFFLERSIESKCILQALRNVGAKVEPHSKFYKKKHRTPDTVWLERMSQKGWVVLMKDKSIANNPLEYLMLMRHGGRAFTLASGQRTGEEETQIILNALPEIIRYVKTFDKPYIVKIYHGSKLEMWLPKGKNPTRT